MSKVTRTTRKRSRLQVGLVLPVIFATVFGPGRGVARASATPLPVEAAGPANDVAAGNPRDKARTLFDQGQIHYSLGEYDQAIARFREAFTLSAAPGLLFNVAQAHRLKGECQQALEVYRHFVRLAPDSPQAGEAEGHIQALVVRCPGSPTQPALATQATAPAATSGTSSLLRPPDADAVAATTPNLDQPRGQSEGARWSTRTRIAVTLLAAGVAIAGGTGLLYWWNDSRHDRWSTEHVRLAAGPGPNTTASEWIARQDSNDSLLRSIWRVDTTVVVTAALSAACVLGSATLGVLPERSPRLAVAPGAISLAWHVSW